MRRLVPYPLLSLFVIFMWLVLNGFTLGQFLISLMVSLFAGFVMSKLQPEKVKIKNWHLVIFLAIRVLCDITTSNISVAWIILTGGSKRNKSGFIIVPLELKNHTGLALLACIMTATPGTAWVAYNSNNSELLVHVLDLCNEDYWQKQIKQRYEALILEIIA